MRIHGRLAAFRTERHPLRQAAFHHQPVARGGELNGFRTSIRLERKRGRLHGNLRRTQILLLLARSQQRRAGKDGHE